MKRKIIKQGNNSFTITLPRQWLNKYSLTASDELEVVEQGNKLTISFEKEIDVEKHVEIDADRTSDLLKRILHSVYRTGYDEIRINYRKAGAIKSVLDILNDFMIGFEVLEQGKNHCVLKNITHPRDIEFESLLKRTFSMIISMGQDLLNSIINKDMDGIVDARQSEIVNNRITSFCRRYINKKTLETIPKTTSVYSLIEYLEEIADQYKFICLYFINNNKLLNESFDKNFIKIFQSVNDQFANFYELFYKFDINKSVVHNQVRKKLIEEIISKFDKGKRYEIRIMNNLLSITQNISNALLLKLAIEEFKR